MSGFRTGRLRIEPILEFSEESRQYTLPLSTFGGIPQPHRVVTPLGGTLWPRGRCKSSNEKRIDLVTQFGWYEIALFLDDVQAGY